MKKINRRKQEIAQESVDEGILSRTQRESRVRNLLWEDLDSGETGLKRICVEMIIVE